MSYPLVSIIIPVYNGSNFLRDSIESALKQTYENKEVIVVNDGSNDGGETEKIALSYGNRIRYHSKENGGVSSALNYGVELMKGDFFSWLSHDDIYYPNKIEEQVKAIFSAENKKCVIVSNSELIDEKGRHLSETRKLIKKYYTSDEMFHVLFNGYSLNGCSLLIPKSALLTSGLFDETLKYIQDWKMWVNIALNQYSFIVVNETLVKTRIHTNQQTVKINNVLPLESKKFTFELLDIFKKDIGMYKNKIQRLLYFGVEGGYIDLVKNCLNILIKSSSLTSIEKIRMYSYFPIGIVKWLLKISYRIYRQKKLRN